MRLLTRKQLSALAVPLLLLAALTAQAGREARGFTRFIPQRLPQQARGDFDGDGRSDLAFIQEGTAGSSISLTLSGPAGEAHFDADVAGLVEGDIDDDGDLDLIAITPTGELVIWINDGQGHFTRRHANPQPAVATETTFDDTTSVTASAVGISDILPALQNRAATTTSGGGVRALNGARTPTFTPGLLPPLRAPPSNAI